MIYGSINSQNLISSLTWNDKFKTALDYLMDLDDNSKLGTTQILGDDFYLNVHTYQTKSEEHCLFESHRKWIDIQYMIRGGEYIEWSEECDLEKNGNYDQKKDVQFYKAQKRVTNSRFHLFPGSLAVFFPGEPHRPQISDKKNRSVFKAVVKINVSLIN